MASSLRIAIAVRGLSNRFSGPREYIQGFADEIVRQRSNHQIYLYYNRSDLIGGIPNAVERCLHSRNRFLWDHLLLPIALRIDEIDLVICPKGTIPLWTPCRAVAIIHDLGYFYPHLNAYKTLETMYMRPMLRYTARRSWGIFTISEFTRQDVIRLLAVPPAKVETIYGAPSELYDSVDDTHQFDLIRSRYHLQEPYIFYPTSLSPRKNFNRLLDAFESVQYLIPHHIYFTGGLSWKSKDITKRLKGPLASRVHRLGIVPQEDMPILYSLAHFTFYASLFEGFGLPLIESFCCGTPVLTSSKSSLPEIAGTAAFIVDPYSVDQIAEGLIRLAKDADLRAQLKQNGFSRASKFSWRKTISRALAWIVSRW